MSLTTTSIEYLERVWNPSGWGCLTGCDYCYARRMAGRSQCHDCQEFRPHHHPERLDAPLRTKNSYRIGVDFMSDLFGLWVEEKWQRRIIGVMEQCEGWAYPNHIFVFLTKHPENLAKFNPWPDNAWVGCTITGAEKPERQQAMMQALGQVEAIIKWVSYEPMLGPLAVSLNNIQWLVVGADSTRGAREPKPEWLKGIQYITCPQWYKNNLPDSWWTEPRRQEVPLT